ncbi:MAG: glycosyltransferase [Oscillochloridaceae bacterium umkhey_bin13]
MPRICLIGAAALSHNPRLLKAADALHAAGYHVHVISAQYLAWAYGFDQRLLAQRQWSYEPVSILPDHLRHRLRFWRSRLRHNLYQRLFGRFTMAFGVAERVNGRLYPEILARALRCPADLYIAHTVRALPIAARAAQRYGAKLAYDAEDLHTEELALHERDTPAQRAIETLERRWINQCDLVTVPSALIAATLAERYRIPSPLVVHNVFPWADRAKLDGQIRERRGPTLSLYWYSQMIGLNRGLADLLRAASLLTTPVQIHLRGSLTPETAATLAQLVSEYGLNGQVHTHPQVHPDELLARTAEHDVGLALELGARHSLSNELTVTNKLFTYMLAGLAVAATATAGQKVVFAANPAIGSLYPSGDYQALALILKGWQDDPVALAQTRTAALEAARTRWNWEYEQQALVQAVATCLIPGHQEVQVKNKSQVFDADCDNS